MTASPDPLPVAAPEHGWVARPLPSSTQLLAGGAGIPTIYHSVPFTNSPGAAVLGAPDMDRCTTYASERQHGTMRHFIGRMRRLVYAFSKSVDT